MCAPKHISLYIPQTEFTRVKSFPFAKTSVICVSIFKAYTCMIFTVTEGFIVGLFFIQAPQEWMKANTKAFLNYTMFDTKKDIIGISFCSGSLYQMLFFRDIFFSVGPHDNIPLHYISPVLG